jgi:hypothetical protein
VARIANLTGEELRELLDLLKGADSVELKLTVLAGRRAEVAGALGFDLMDAQLRQVFFFDTPDLDLYQSGVVVRARRRQNDTGDTVIKIRPVDPAMLPADLRADPEFGVEIDAMPGGYVCSASFKGSADNARIKEAVGGALPTRKIFSKRQRAFFEERAPKGITLDDLKVLGPIPTTRAKTRTEGYDRPMVGELWLYPDGSQVVELSTKTAPEAAFQTAMEWRAFLDSAGIEVSGEQQTKTRVALEFFTRD